MDKLIVMWASGRPILASKYIKLFAVLLPVYFFLLFPKTCYANVIVPFYSPSQPWGMLWLISPLIEATAIVFVLKRKFVNLKAQLGMFGLIVLLNLITIPITSFLGGFLYHDGQGFVFIAELFPLIAEFLVIFWLFNIFYKRGITTERITAKFIFFLIFAVNLATYLVGYAIYDYYPLPKPDL